MELTELMADFRVEALKSIAKRAGIAKTLTRKAELIQALDRFFKSDLVGFLERLSSTERTLLAEAVHGDNRIHPDVFSAKYRVPCPRPDRWGKQSGDRLKLTKKGERLLGKLLPETFRKGVERLMGDDKFDELQRINHIRGQTGTARRWMTKPSQRRHKIGLGLAQWPVDQWLTFDEACRFLAASGHVFRVTGRPDSLYFCEQRYGYLHDQEGIARQYLRVLLMESLATLGVVDVAYVYPHYQWPELSDSWGTDDLDFCGRYDGLLYVRLTPLGAYCFDVADQYTPPAVPRRSLFTMLPNREIVVLDGTQISAADLSMLELFARQRGDHLWRIEEQVMLDFLERGGRLDDLWQFLADHSAEEIPGTIRALFDGAKAKGDAVAAAEEAWLVKFREPQVAALVAHDAKAGKLCLLAGDRHLAVPKKNERAFRTALKKLGYVLPQ